MNRQKLKLFYFLFGFGINFSTLLAAELSGVDRFVIDPSGECIIDKKTNLVWTRDASILGALTWGQKNNDFTAQYWVSQMNTNPQSIGYHLCGYSDWRLPTRWEMLDILTAIKGENSCSIPANIFNQSKVGFTHVRTERYWAACSTDSSHAWYVSMSNGSSDSGELDTLGYVWPVRGNNAGLHK